MDHSRAMWMVLALLLSCWTTASTSGDNECKTLLRSNVTDVGGTKRLTSDQLDHHFIYGNASDYILKSLLGKGASGEAHLADCPKLGKECVVKLYTSTHFILNQMLNEVLMLQTVCGGPNVMKIYDVIKWKDGRPALILEYVPSNYTDIDRTYRSLAPAEVQFYMKEFLTGLAYVHNLSIIHRDIKPPNVLVDRRHRMIRIIDFGQATVYNPAAGKMNNWLDWYVAPEFMMKDVRQMPLFRGPTHESLMTGIVKVLGSDDLVTYLGTLHRSPNMSEPFFHMQPKSVPWKDIVKRDKNSAAYAIPEALDLIHHLVRWNPDDRLSANEALKHPYFSVMISPTTNTLRGHQRHLTNNLYSV